MPPRHAYWTIILEGKPTAFRAHDREELLPTLRQLQVRHPDAVMMWFARGRLWESPDAQRAAMHRPPPERRGEGWRPGGEHRDPRDRFKVPRDEKRRRFAAKIRRDRSEGPRDQREERERRPPAGKPGGFPRRDFVPREQREGRSDRRPAAPRGPGDAAKKRDWRGPGQPGGPPDRGKPADWHGARDRKPGGWRGPGNRDQSRSPGGSGFRGESRGPKGGGFHGESRGPKEGGFRGESRGPKGSGFRGKPRGPTGSGWSKPGDRRGPRNGGRGGRGGPSR